MWWLILGLAIVVLIAVWLTWTAMRIDRLNARCDAGWAALDAQLVRRSSALRALADGRPATESASGHRITSVVVEAMAADRERRAGVENMISAAIADLQPAGDDPHWSELAEAATRVRVARTFYNDAVRANRALREQRLPRLLHLGARTPAPPYFDIDDTAGTQVPTNHAA